MTNRKKRKIKRKHQKACNRKKGYKTKNEAYTVLNRIRLKTNYTAVYKCPVCKKYHFTSGKKVIKVLELIKKLEK